jgi:hypothetical protein
MVEICLYTLCGQILKIITINFISYKLFKRKLDLRDVSFGLDMVELEFLVYQIENILEIYHKQLQISLARKGKKRVKVILK